MPLTAAIPQAPAGAYWAAGDGGVIGRDAREGAQAAHRRLRGPAYGGRPYLGGPIGQRHVYELLDVMREKARHLVWDSFPFSMSKYDAVHVLQGAAGTPRITSCQGYIL
jgi:hypothetical protein